MWNRVLVRKASASAVTTALLACLLLSAAGGGASALAQGPAQPLAPAGPVLISYQGLLLDPGTGDPKPNGTYQMVFALYDVENGGTALWSETKTLQVDKGLFSTMLGDQVGIPAAVFDGRSLWLGVAVGADPEATPRSRLGYAAGALYARNSDTLDGQHASAFAIATHLHSGADITSGTVAEPRIDPAVARDSEIMPTVLANDGPASGLDADTLDGQQASAFASTSTIMPTVLANDGSGSTLDADLLDSLNSTAFARATHVHSGADITTGIVAEPRIDAGIARDSEIMPTVLANDGTSSGLDADFLDGQHGSYYQNAGNINAGILDPARFSAYADLVADSRIGTGATQVAAGDHLHDARYYTQALSDGRYVNVDGDSMSGTLTVLVPASGSHGVSSITASTATGAAGVEGKNTGAGYGVLATSVSNAAVAGSSTNSYGGYFYSQNGTALRVAGTAQVDTQVTTPKVVYSPARIEYFSVGPEAFNPASNVSFYNSVGQAYIVSGSCCDLVAPVHLPQGAIVTQLNIYFTDSAAVDLTFTFYNKPLSSTSYQSLATYTTSGSAGAGSVSVPLNATIDNMNGSYFIDAYNNSWPANNTLTIKGVSIRYTIAEAH